MFMTGTGGLTLSDMLLFSLSIAGILAIFVGFVTGVIALFRKKDRSVLLIIVTLLCFLISGFLLLFMSEGFIS
jgi:predicted membrane-bound dolichyl-phosphate-mannose-protein mannosyltransferase